MKKRTGLYPGVQVDAAACGVVSQAGGVALLETARVSGLDRLLSVGLGPWRAPRSMHDPAKVLLDLAVTLALGGDCLADVAVLRREPGVYGRVASDRTVSRAIDTLGAPAPRALLAINRARTAARAAVWKLAGRHSPDHEVSAERPLVVDIDATLVTSHSDKEAARPTFKRGFGHHPLWACADHGQHGTGEPLAVLLRPGNVGSNTAADHITVLRDALRELPGHQTGRRPGRKVLVKIDGADANHQVLDWLTAQRLSCSVGYGLPANTEKLLPLLPQHVWPVADDSDGSIRDGAWVAEITGLLDLTGWPPGMRIIGRKERPHPGAQLIYRTFEAMTKFLGKSLGIGLAVCLQISPQVRGSPGPPVAEGGDNTGCPMMTISPVAHGDNIVTTSFPSGQRIARVAGLLESRVELPKIEGWTAVLELDSHSVILLAQHDFAIVSEWPADAVALPTQVIDGDSDLVGEALISGFRVHTAAQQLDQLYFLLDSRRILGVVNTARGTRFHVESALTAPVLRGRPVITSLNGRKLDLDDIVS